MVKLLIKAWKRPTGNSWLKSKNVIPRSNKNPISNKTIFAKKKKILSQSVIKKRAIFLIEFLVFFFWTRTMTYYNWYILCFIFSPESQTASHHMLRRVFSRHVFDFSAPSLYTVRLSSRQTIVLHALKKQTKRHTHKRPVKLTRRK